MKDSLDALSSAVSGLLYPSESDNPFEVFNWANAYASIEAALSGNVQVSGRRITEVPFQQFFDELADADNADRFRELHAVLLSQLGNPRVFRVGDGDRKIDIYLIGELSGGSWAGLHTCSVET